jgi:hypothetical protein
MKRSRIVFYYVFDLWRKFKAEKLVLQLRVRKVSVSGLECHSD